MSSAFDLTGRSALVTGAGSSTGIGFATARLLGEMGASVIITSTTDRIHERVRELHASGTEAFGIVGDLTNPDTAPLLVASALERWGRLDIVVQNAGMTSISRPQAAGGDIEEMEYGIWQEGLARNLDTTFHVTKACLPVMKAAHGGRLIFVSSVTGPVMASKGDPAYAAAKAAMVGLAERSPWT